MLRYPCKTRRYRTSGAVAAPILVRHHVLVAALCATKKVPAAKAAGTLYPEIKRLRRGCYNSLIKVLAGELFVQPVDVVAEVGMPAGISPGSEIH